ncbi:hypothetical protein MAR_016011 [Mya arenaria]|uniref:YqaJ viral recombinase domain-containing protein n=1 Tax=Mya arenaria TaxID=6604 RepID=A0ABY7FKC8_MYAAR|nr:hypothetical protein MAR_016011 [Mya arenaria]
MTWGTKHEPAARRKYWLTVKKQFPDVKLSECGLFVNGDVPYLGANPDGVRSSAQTDRDQFPLKIVQKIRTSFKLAAVYVRLDTTIFKSSDKMALNGKPWCDFVVWTLGGVSVERILFD